MHKIYLNITAPSATSFSQTRPTITKKTHQIWVFSSTSLGFLVTVARSKVSILDVLHFWSNELSLFSLPYIYFSRVTSNISRRASCTKSGLILWHIHPHNYSKIHISISTCRILMFFISSACSQSALLSPSLTCQIIIMVLSTTSMDIKP